jgi:hypothetical protein
MEELRQTLKEAIGIGNKTETKFKKLTHCFIPWKSLAEGKLNQSELTLEGNLKMNC